jgi:hypothetical protein
VTDDAISEKPFVLMWTSQNQQLTLKRGEYASIAEASDDLPAAKARLQAEYPTGVDDHFPHDIQAGTWRVVVASPTRPV